MSACDFCGLPDVNWVLRAGRITYNACYLCYAHWQRSTKTPTDLAKLRAWAAHRRNRREATR